MCACFSVVICNEVHSDVRWCVRVVCMVYTVSMSENNFLIYR